MPLYEITDDHLTRRSPAAFAELGLYERADLQRLLRHDVSALGEDLLVVAEEYGQWEDARRRIDLLAIDKAGRLVVIELKRTDDGGHMELQAIRYAAMVSSMGFDEVERAFAAHCAKYRADEDLDPHAELVKFLDATDADENPVVSTEVRIILVAADFGREITTTVLWLTDSYGMDIRCVRLVPYGFEGKVLLDIQQVLPLPEAADYRVRLRRKEEERERAHADGRDFTRYHVIVDGVELPDQNKRNAVRVMIEQLAEHGVALEQIRAKVPHRAFKVLPGKVTDPELVPQAMLDLDPTADLGRWFCDHPMVDDQSNGTYVLSKMWGLSTEPTLTDLSEAFPDAKISFRRANP